MITLADIENDSLGTYPQFVPTSAPVAELESLGDQIAELSAHLDAATARLLDLIREFDVRGGWNNGFRSCAEWLTWRIGLDPGAARERVRVARALGTLPRLAQALSHGELSYWKVRALTRVATPETEERLLAVGRAGTAKHVELIVRGWRQVDRKAEALQTIRRHPADTHADVSAATCANVSAATRVDISAETRSGETPPTWEQLQADALGLIAETALHRGIDPGAPAERYQVVVHIDAPVLADADAPGQSVVEDGTHVAAETARRLACDAARVVMRHDADGRISEVSARKRTISPALRRALEHRDRGCQFPGCGRRFTQGHHIRHWAQGGPTTLSNLALLCPAIIGLCTKKASPWSDGPIAS